MTKEIEKLKEQLSHVLNPQSLEKFYENCCNTARTKPKLFHEITPLLAEALQNLNNDWSTLKNFYNSCKEIAQARPELTEDIIPLLSQALQNPENDYHSLIWFYKSCVEVAKARPELFHDIIPLLAEALQNPSNEWSTMNGFYDNCKDIARARPELIEDIIPLLSQALQKPENGYDSICKFYGSWRAVAQTRPELIEDIIPLLSQVLQKPENDSDSLGQFYWSCREVAKARPELFHEITPLLAEALQNPNNDWSSINVFYNNSKAIVEFRPELAEDIIPLLSQALQNPENNKNSLESFRLSIGAIAQARPELTGELLTLLSQINTQNFEGEEKAALKDSYFRIAVANPDYTDQVFEKLLQFNNIKPDHFSEFERKMIKFNLFSPKLSMTEKQYFYNKRFDYAASVNGGLYLNIKNRLLDLEMHDQKHAGQQIESKDQLFENVAEWMIPCALALQKIYGKDYMPYLQKMAQYNAFVDKQIKAQTPEKLAEREQKLSSIWQEVEKQQAQEIIRKFVFEKADEKRRHALAEASNDCEKLELEATRARNEWIAENVKTRRLKTDYAEACRQIVYSPEYRLDVHNALDWMANTSNIKDKELLKKFVDDNLFYSNKYGQKLCRLHAPSYDHEQKEIVCTNELKVIAGRWNSLSEEERSKPYNEVYSICQSMCYDNQQNAEFAKEANKNGVSEAEYKNYEDIYLKSLQTESVFDPNFVKTQDDLRVRIAPRDDVRVGFAGKYTSCCQHFGGIGHDCAVDSMIGPKSGALLIEEFNPKSKDWNMLGVSWIYESKRKFKNQTYKVLTLDNVEMKRSSSEAEKLLLSYVTDLQQQKGYYQVNIGTGRNDIGINGFAPDTEGKNPLPEGYSGYSDAGSQKIMVKASKEDLAKGIVKPLDENMPEIYITGATENDFFAAQEVARQCFPQGDQQLELPDKNPLGMLLKDGNKTVGYVIFSDTEKYISDMAVLPEYRKDKNASSAKLLAAMVKHVSEVGGEWHAELRDSTSMRYMQIMEKRGIVEMTVEDDYREMSDGSKVTSVRFKPIKEADRKPIKEAELPSREEESRRPNQEAGHHSTEEVSRPPIIEAELPPMEEVECGRKKKTRRFITEEMEGQSTAMRFVRSTKARYG